MSYIVEQKIKGNIYLYRVESYWDKDKKQSRQKRTYLGPKNRRKKGNKSRKLNIINKKFGNIFLLNAVSERLGLTKLLRELFGELSSDILNLAYFFICDDRASYLYSYWLNEQYAPLARRLNSNDISGLYQNVGGNQQAVADFFERWVSLCSPNSVIYFDITSISSYSTNIDFVEWGYNRDHENLPQINMGILCTKKSELPLFYQIYPGSISDVSTLNNCLTRLEWLGIKDVVLVLDRGFCSKANILKLNKMKDKILFIQPMTFSLKLLKQLIKKHRRHVEKMQNAFKFNEEILYHFETTVELEGHPFRVHLYYNEKAGLDQRHTFLARLLTIEKEIGSREFESMKEYLDFRSEQIPDKDSKFFKLDRKRRVIVRNTRAISEHLARSGYLLFLSNSERHGRDSILNYYRSRDIVEKMFDVEKNQLDGKRLRAHTPYNADGRIFVKFVALILHSYLSRVMKTTKLFEQYSVREMLAAISKIRCTTINEKMLTSEISKSQRNILKAFEISPEMVAQS